MRYFIIIIRDIRDISDIRDIRDIRDITISIRDHIRDIRGIHFNFMTNLNLAFRKR